MLKLFLNVVAVLGLFSSAIVHGSEGSGPNILFVIADDASRHFGDAYGCRWVKTPNIDRLAKAGLVFDNAYVPTSKCAPCRAAILTGRNPWQLEEAANHQNHFPSKFTAFSDAMKRLGIHSGSCGKVWGPGSAVDADGEKRDFGLPSAGPKNQPGKTFAKFLKDKPADKPFFYWYGSSDPHRAYEAGAGLKAGKKLSDIDRVPGYWPDNDIVRSDMLDYAMEVEAFDSQVGELLDALNEAGQTENTLVIVTSDHGMPFPRVKGHTYDDAHHVPMVMSWPNGIQEPGRRVSQLVSMIDLAPTFLELAGITQADSGMQSITGRSLTDLLHDKPSVRRPVLLIGRERNDVYARRGSDYGLGYPVRAIRGGDYLYIRNLAPERWPCGDPDLGLKDTDASPTKKLVEDLCPDSPYWQHSFGKRPAEQLFNIQTDPDCLQNLMDDPQHRTMLERLQKRLTEELQAQQDPRQLGTGDAFDNYPSIKPRPKDWPPATPVP
ncbi:MAG: sulfatase [Planctomycetaceae bacterium]